MTELTAAEIEFIAEQEVVTIVSSIEHDQFYFLSGNFGPLFAGLPAEVPLWLAITLRRKGKCTIQIPGWMSVENLEAVVASEKSDTNFQPLPFHYLEIAQMLINFAKEDIPMIDKVTALLQDIENIRMDRARLGLKELADRVSDGQRIHLAGLRNISAAERRSIGGFMTSSFDMFRRLTTAEKQERSKQYSRKYSALTTPAASTNAIPRDVEEPIGYPGDGVTTSTPAAKGLRKFRKG